MRELRDGMKRGAEITGGGAACAMRGLAFTIPALRAAYAAGIRPADVINEAWRRIETVGDPGIFLHLVPRERVLRWAEALGRA